MKRLVCLAGALAVIGLAVLSASLAGAADEKAATIKDVMDALHKEAKSPLAQLKAELKAESPDWAKIKMTTKEFVTYGAALPKTIAPRRFSGFQEARHELLQRRQGRRRGGAEGGQVGRQAAFSKLTGMCKTCHAAHKEQ